MEIETNIQSMASPSIEESKTECLINGKIKHKLGDNGLIPTPLSTSSDNKVQNQLPSGSAGDISPSEDQELCSCDSENTTDTTLTENSHKGENTDFPSNNSDLDLCDSLNQLEISDSTQEKSMDGIDYEIYKSEAQMPDIMRLITKDLSEPYSVYTYRYFIHNWPKLCFLAMYEKECVGAIVCKLDVHKKMVRRGYIAMLAIDSEHRRKKIGSRLVRKAIAAMMRDDCDEVVLETEITNKGALKLYENLGFVRDKRLFRYYLNGVDALRLKLWLR